MRSSFIWIGLISIVATILFFTPFPVKAQEALQSKPTIVNIYFFWDKECLHCQNENMFLKKLTKENTGIQVHSFEVSEVGNGVLLQEIAKEYELDLSSVPVTFIGGEYLIGFESDETTGQEIRDLVTALKDIGDSDEIGKFIFESQNNQIVQSPTVNNDEQNMIPKEKHPIDKILDKFKADIILGGILFVVIIGFIVSKFRKLH